MLLFWLLVACAVSALALQTGKKTCNTCYSAAVNKSQCKCGYIREWWSAVFRAGWSAACLPEN